MKPHLVSRQALVLVGLLCGAMACGSPPTAAPPLPEAPPAAADERDRQVVEAALLALLADSRFDMAGAAADGSYIVLGDWSPPGTGSISPEQVRAEAWPERNVPDDLIEALVLRNQVPGTYDCRRASWSSLKFDDRILVADLAPVMQLDDFRPFRDRFSEARGWAIAWLPGYSSDGQRAIVRASIGPSAHGASVTALVELRGVAWVVTSLKLAWYA